MKKTGTTEQALLTNHNPEPHVRRRLSESATPATLPIIYCCSFMSFSVGCLSSSRVIGTQRDIGLAETSVVQYVCAFDVATVSPILLHLLQDLFLHCKPHNCLKSSNINL
uniref:Ovule protein n=1 Tax=Mesocestoides corti TaxID=53468 RepID=A0A5K3FWT4_MESCO